jgi:Fic family protein
MISIEGVKKNFLGYTLSLRDYSSLFKDERTSFNYDLIYQSNFIEGISDHWVQTVSEGEEFTFPPTLSSHEEALKYTENSATLGRELNRREIRDLHGKLMKGLLPQNKEGHYRKVPVAITITASYLIGGELVPHRKVIRRCPPPEKIPYLMNAYEKSARQFENNPEVSQEELLENHAYFEWIHPFVDGNGRVGRLILNWLSLKHRQEFFVIESAKREEYYKFLKSLEGKFNSLHPRIERQIKN